MTDTPPAFPVLPGQGWSVHKRPTFATRLAPHVSGREVRASLYAAPLWEFEVTFDGLASGSAYPGLGANSLQALLGLFLRCQGRFGTFLYTDSTDNTVTGGAIGVGDGTTLAFPALRTLGGFSEPVGWVTALRAVSINGAAVGGWSLAAPNRITFAGAPAAGAVIGADFSFAYLCRFVDDVQDFENVMAGLWKAEAVKFRSVRT
ncbi:MAG: uncharacterized protein K0Q54_3097 [Methylobacterium brachiatum]|nr:uncharacterized protein [Methylobacterium brachiatum]